MYVDYPSKAYKSVRLMAQVLMLIVIERGYHLFHYFGHTYGWRWFGYAIGPLLYGILLLGVFRWHRDWMNRRQLAPLCLPKERLLPLLAYGLGGVALAIGTNWLWGLYWNRPFLLEWSKLDVVLNYKAWFYHDGPLLGTLIFTAYYIGYAVKIYLALQIGNICYHLGCQKSEILGRVALFTSCLVTFGLSETMYYGKQTGAFLLVSTAIGLAITGANPKRWAIIWTYVMLAFLI